MNILAFETSCDETSAAIIRDGRRILSNVVASQIDLHTLWGGVVPELASRQHILYVIPTLEETLRQAGLTWAEVDAIAVTNGPGLAGALLVGVNVAKGLAFALGKPLLPVNHLAGHIYANWLIPTANAAPQPLVVAAPEPQPAPAPTASLLDTGSRRRVLGATELPPFERQGTPIAVPELRVQPPIVEAKKEKETKEPGEPKFPLVCLVVSGGHTELVLMRGHGRYELLGKTIDDAAGEAFDKVARLLGLGYPGGPAIQQLVEETHADPRAIDLPRAWLRGSFDFSFSGLKTAVLRKVEEYGGLPIRPKIRPFAEVEAEQQQRDRLAREAEAARPPIIVAGKAKEVQAASTAAPTNPPATLQAAVPAQEDSSTQEPTPAAPDQTAMRPAEQLRPAALRPLRTANAGSSVRPRRPDIAAGLRAQLLGDEAPVRAARPAGSVPDEDEDDGEEQPTTPRSKRIAASGPALLRPRLPLVQQSGDEDDEDDEDEDDEQGQQLTRPASPQPLSGAAGLQRRPLPLRPLAPTDDEDDGDEDEDEDGLPPFTNPARSTVPAGPGLQRRPLPGMQSSQPTTPANPSAPLPRDSSAQRNSSQPVSPQRSGAEEQSAGLIRRSSTSGTGNNPTTSRPPQHSGMSEPPQPSRPQQQPPAKPTRGNQPPTAGNRPNTPSQPQRPASGSQPPQRSTSSSNQPVRPSNQPVRPAPPPPKPLADRPISAVPKGNRAADVQDEDAELEEPTRHALGSAADDEPEDDNRPRPHRSLGAEENAGRPLVSSRLAKDKPPLDPEDFPLAEIAAAFQLAVIEVLVEKTAAAAEQYGAKCVILGGGVAASKLLRTMLADRLSIPLLYPPPALCTDNAAMVGAAAFYRYYHPQAPDRDKADSSDWAMDIEPNAHYLGNEE